MQSWPICALYPPITDWQPTAKSKVRPTSNDCPRRLDQTILDHRNSRYHKIAGQRLLGTWCFILIARRLPVLGSIRRLPVLRSDNQRPLSAGRRTILGSGWRWTVLRSYRWWAVARRRSILRNDRWLPVSGCLSVLRNTRCR
jgi:hypothetical protein